MFSTSGDRPTVVAYTSWRPGSGSASDGRVERPAPQGQHAGVADPQRAEALRRALQAGQRSGGSRRGASPSAPSVLAPTMGSTPMTEAPPTTTAATWCQPKLRSGRSISQGGDAHGGGQGHRHRRRGQQHLGAPAASRSASRGRRSRRGRSRPAPRVHACSAQPRRHARPMSSGSAAASRTAHTRGESATGPVAKRRTWPMPAAARRRRPVPDMSRPAAEQQAAGSTAGAGRRPTPTPHGPRAHEAAGRRRAGRRTRAPRARASATSRVRTQGEGLDHGDQRGEHADGAAAVDERPAGGDAGSRSAGTNGSSCEARASCSTIHGVRAQVTSAPHRPAARALAASGSAR